ncbi:3-hydroxyacyl-CoA dehydrogenase family protein [Chlamydiales bacterium]|nr:3-hydroxyacyl-CoA dehydrogenase family protein [Chlamydiales bacterium]
MLTSKTDCALFGASGTMGKGIALLLLEKTEVLLTVIDQKPVYLRDDLRSVAERNIISLRHQYREREDLVSNQEIIEAEVNRKLTRVHFASKLYHADLIFEAISEDIEVKKQLFSEYRDLGALFLSNTSSIPIHVLNEGMEDQVIGFHFYNPPLKQKLIEVVATEKRLPFVLDLAKKLGKNPVFANDVAGFIGNGHLIRELTFALSLDQDPSLINSVTCRLLKRPMGIFDLARWVGIDVLVSIGTIMSRYLGESLHLEKLRELPKLHEAKELDESLAKMFLEESRRIQNLLVTTGAANSLDDVQTVLKEGFKYGIV